MGGREFDYQRYLSPWGGQSPPVLTPPLARLNYLHNREICVRILYIKNIK